MPLFDIELDNGDVLTVEHPQSPTPEEAQALIGTIPSSSKPQAPASTGRLAEPRLTFPQLAALQVTTPLAGLIGSQLRGSPVTAIEAASEGALEEIGRAPGAIAELGVRGVLPPSAKLINTIGEAAGVIPKGTLENLIKQAVSPLNRAPQQISEALGIEQGPERAKFRDPNAAAVGELGSVIFNPIGTQSKAGQIVGRVPGEIAKALTPTPTTVDAARLVREALKPSNAQTGKRVEKAAADSLEDIFVSNPYADKAGEMAIEGFANEVTKLRKSIGQEIGTISSQQKAPITTGEDIAIALNKRADQLEKAGQPAATVASLRNRANDFSGKEMQIGDIQEATTIANRQNSGFFKRTREMASPLLADVDTMANQIIAEVGGKGINTVLGNLAGPRGVELRKQWSNLRTIEDQAEKRLNQLINSAPPETQSAVASALTSLEGLGGLVALGSGLKSGIIPVIGAIAKKWSKNAEKILKDSNEKISKVYKQFRANPPAERPPPIPFTRKLAPEEIPPTFDEALEASLQRAIQEQNAAIEAQQAASQVGFF